MTEPELAEIDPRTTSDYVIQWLENLLSNPDVQGRNKYFGSIQNGHTTTCCAMGALLEIGYLENVKTGLSGEEIYSLRITVIDMNDKERKTFEEIAEYLIGYFTEKGIL